MHPILHANILFSVKLFAKIILSWNSLKYILCYLLKLSDPFIKNENSALPTSIQKNFQQKIYFCLLKMVYCFLNKGNPIFSIKLEQRLSKLFSQLNVKNSRFFLSYYLKKDDWPKAYAGPRLDKIILKWQPKVPNKTIYLPIIKGVSNKIINKIVLNLFVLVYVKLDEGERGLWG